ncbi:hypothetical protein [Metabacillus iocasae]|uniref:Uncharacterized protein n=1 Tax=Priestia iocasae TaxID=2291674 RepID=A0ABS2QTT0_9BACI|nr:hypothetical protein [Metabacillus iocasae]MBM7702880.1 hypothetical protein [Metabacillus iocasae]
MKVYEKVTVTKEVPALVTCNKCGKSEALIGARAERSHKSDLFHTFEMMFGYGSSFDSECWDFDLCEDCLVEFVKSFKHAPTITHR